MAKRKISLQDIANKLDSLLVELRGARSDIGRVKVQVRRMADKTHPVPRRKTRLSKIEGRAAAKKLALRLLKKGFTYDQITDQLNRNIPNFKISRSAVSRFWIAYRKEKQNDHRD